MNTFIYDVNGNIYYFKKLGLKKTIALQSKLAKIKDSELDVIVDTTIDVFKSAFIESNPEYTGDFDTDVIDYNYSEIGLENLIALMNAILEEVFQLKEANTNKYPFLPIKKQEA